MSSGQKAIKYAAIAFAIFLIVNIGLGILSFVGSGLFMFSTKEGSSKVETADYEISDNIESLNMEINAAVVEIRSGDEFALESNCEKLTVEEENGNLIIKEKSKKIFRNIKSKIVLTIPNDYQFEDIYMKAGAGKVKCDNLCADTMDLNFGAGEVDINGLIANNDIKIEGGVGEVDIVGCVLNDGQINMGVGEFNIAGKLTGRSKIDYGVGEANLKLEGSSEDYTVELNKGLGESKINGESVKSDTVYGTGENYIEIDGGIGEIEVEFY